MKSRRAPIGACAAAFTMVGGLGAPSIVFAQEAPPSQLDAVIVTTQKRIQDRLDVPVSVTVFGGAQLADVGAATLRDLAALTPGFYAETISPRSPVLVIRGISSDTTDVTAEPRVSVFENGVDASRTQGSVFELFDVQRVEIAKGPQPTLFGRSALTGAVSIVTRRADPTTRAGLANVEAGNLGGYSATGVFNEPLGEKAAVRFAATIRHRDGYVPSLSPGDRDFGGFTNAALRFSAHAEPWSGATVDLVAGYENDRFSGVPVKSSVFYPSNPTTGAVLGDLDPYSGATLAAAPGFPLGQRLGGHRLLNTGSVLIDQKLGSIATLSSITGYRKVSAPEVVDLDGSSIPLITQGGAVSGEQISEELRLSHVEARWSGFLGVSVSHERIGQAIPLEIDERTLLALLTGYVKRTNPTAPTTAAITAPAVQSALLQGLLGAYGVSLPAQQVAAIAANLSSTHVETLARLNERTSTDLFGEATVHLTPRFELTAGARYEVGDQDVRFRSSSADRSILSGVFGALFQTGAAQRGLLGLLAVPGARTIPQSATYPIGFLALAEQPTATPAGDQKGQDDSGIGWRIVARYSPTPNTSLYAGYARGRRPKVLGTDAPLTPGGPVRFTSVPAETVDSIEVGAKARLLDGHLNVQAAVYDYSYSHFQTEIQQGLVFSVLDAGRAGSTGAELEAQWAVARNIDVEATYSYAPGRFKNGLYKDNHFPFSPDHSLSLRSQLRAPMFGGMVEFIPIYSWRSRVFFDNTNGILSENFGAFLQVLSYQGSQAERSQVDLRTSFTPPRGNWKVGAYVTNVLNKRYLRAAGPGSLTFGIPSYIAAPPRVFGFSLDVRL